jgi:hypothetical protein
MTATRTPNAAFDPDDFDPTPEPYPVAVKLTDEGGQDRDICDGDDHPNMTDLIQESLARGNS